MGIPITFLDVFTFPQVWRTFLGIPHKVLLSIANAGLLGNWVTELLGYWVCGACTFPQVWRTFLGIPLAKLGSRSLQYKVLLSIANAG